MNHTLQLSPILKSNSIKWFEPRQSFRGQQENLYKLICQKTKENQSLKLSELIGLYKEASYWKDLKITVHYYENNQWHSKRRDMTDKEIIITVQKWFFSNLGYLVRKGYLKVLPIINLEE